LVHIDRRFRSLTRLKSASPKTWADAYLDRALRDKTKALMLLEESSER
jgi:hypothetical protein